MAKFHDQFKKRDPLTFNAFGIYDSWPRQIAWEARDLLKGVDSHRLNEMAQKVESVILDQVAYLQRFPEPESFHTFASNPMTIAQGMLVYGSDELIRERHGDVNLFVAASMPLHPAEIGATLPFKQWEGLAVLTLWKLADFYDTMLQLYKLLENGQRNKPTTEARLSAFTRGGPMVVEAMRACTLAAEGRMRMQQLAVMASDADRKVCEALYEVETVRRREVSNKSRAALAVRYSKTKDHQAEALKYALSRPFKSRAEAARYVADMVQKGPNVFYTVAVVDGWLKAANWQSVGVSTA